MASDDVIELGSSDEDTPKPPPKKRKPPVNAMVHIPKSLTEITIKPAKSSTKINPACIVKGVIGKAVTVSKVTKNNINPYSNIKKINGKPVSKQVSRLPQVKKYVHNPIQNNLSIPITGAPISNSNIPIIYKSGLHHVNKTANKGYHNFQANCVSTNKINPLNMIKSRQLPSSIPVKFLNNDQAAAMKLPTPMNVKNLSILRPGITVKRTGASQIGTDGKNKKMAYTVVKMSKPSVITTVDLDDDEPSSGTSSASGPQWYLRPEDQNESPQKTLEEPVNTIEDDGSKDETEEKEKSLPLISPNKSVEKSSQNITEKSLDNSLSPLDSSELEQQNNKEPDKTNFIEITIEDSPLKPTRNKKGFIIGAELAITIEDSPVKNMVDKPVSNCSGEDETNVSPKDHNSKKKLVYPKEMVQELETIEIEFEPLSSEDESKNITECGIEKTVNVIESTKEKSPIICQMENNKSNTIEEETKSEIRTVIRCAEFKQKTNEISSEKSKTVKECSEIVEIEDSPLKPLDTIQTTTPKKIKPTKQIEMVNIDSVALLDDKEKNDFHPVYQSFINLCFQLENSDDMKKIVDKKIKSYYCQVPKDYTESEAFIDMVSSKIMAMKAGPEKMYLYIKDVVDELNLQRKLAKSQPPPKEPKNEEREKFLYGEDSEFDSKRQRQIRKLEKTLKKLHRAIQKLEEQEVDFDDEEDSVYLLTDSEDVTPSKDDKPLDKEVLLQRYKERMVRVHAKLCQLTNTKMPSEARVQIDARPGQPKGPAKRLEKWINRKVPIGTPLPFPDFHDVLRCVRDANQEDKLGWNEADIMEEARDLFTRCGKKLQRRRQENEWRLAASRLPVDVADPAEDSADLKRKLEENKRTAAKRETEVLNKYADRQTHLNLEAVEIGDKEAEESPVESDEEEPVEDKTSMTSKEKRKERLKRLLQEKSKKASEEKDNKLANSPVEVANSPNDDAEMKDPNKDTITTKDDDATKDSEHKNEGNLQPKLPNNHQLNTDLSEKGKDMDGSISTSKHKGDNESQSDKVHSLSDDSNEVESDVDELHLLQKLYSENELNTSVMDSSDSGTPIAISDTSSANEISCDERRNKKTSCDVISIENSSYSESEEKKGNVLIDTETDDVKAVKETVNADMEIEYSDNGVDKENRRSISENRQSVENVLFASSDEAEETETRIETQPITSGDSNSVTCINLRDDSISIGETVIEETRKCGSVSEDELKADNSDKNTNTDASSVEGMEIGPEIHSDEQKEIMEYESIIDNGVDKKNRRSISENRQSVENVLFASSDEAEETETRIGTQPITSGDSNSETCINLRDDSISIGETVIEETRKCGSVSEDELKADNSDKNTNTDASSVEGMEIGPEIHSDKQKEIMESESVKSTDEGSVTEITSIKSIEEENDVETTSLKSVETIEDGSGNESTGIKSDEIIEIKNANETSNKSLGSDNANQTTIVKDVESNENGNINETTIIKSIETIEDGNVNETISINSVEFIDDENVEKETSIKSGDIVEDDKVKTTLKSVEPVDDKKINETPNSGKIINHESVPNEMRDSTSVEKITEDIQDCLKDNVVPTDITDIDKNVVVNMNYYSLHESMEVDSCENRAS